MLSNFVKVCVLFLSTKIVKSVNVRGKNGNSNSLATSLEKGEDSKLVTVDSEGYQDFQLKGSIASNDWSLSSDDPHTMVDQKSLVSQDRFQQILKTNLESHLRNGGPRSSLKNETVSFSSVESSSTKRKSPNRGAAHRRDQSSTWVTQVVDSELSLDTQLFLFSTANVIASPSGAAGPLSIISTVQNHIEARTKSGSIIFSMTSLEDMFTGVIPSYTPIDFSYPQIIFDSLGDRFVLFVEDDRTIGSQNFTTLVAVSKTNNPRTTSSNDWWFHRIPTRMDADASKDLSSAVFPWYTPGVGVDEEAIYLTHTMYFVSNNTFDTSLLWILDKSDYYSANDQNAFTVHNFYKQTGVVGTGRHAIATVRNTTGITSGVGTYLVTYGGIHFTATGASALQLILVSNPLSANPAFRQNFVSLGIIDSTVRTAALPNAPQTSSTVSIATGDRNVFGAVWENGAVWVASQRADESGKTSVFWAKVNANGILAPTLASIGFIDGDEISPGAHTFYPSIDVNADGYIALGFSASGSNITVGSYAIIVNPDGTTESSTPDIVKAGVDPYIVDEETSPWGLYSGMSIDPSDGNCFWTFNQFASSDCVQFLSPAFFGCWDTAWARLCAGSASTPAPVPSTPPTSSTPPTPGPVPIPTASPTAVPIPTSGPTPVPSSISSPTSDPTSTCPSPAVCGNSCGNCDKSSDSRSGCSCDACECTVCDIDSACCSSTWYWDEKCVAYALENCECGGSSPTSSPTGPPSCPDVASCGGSCGDCDQSSDERSGCSCDACECAVCALDSACCSSTWVWDETCVSLALENCQCEATECTAPSACQDGSCGDCREPRPFETGCSCDGCQCRVCEIDPYCCDTSWDRICVTEAELLCTCEDTVLTSSPTSSPTVAPTASPTECVTYESAVVDLSASPVGPSTYRFEFSVVWPEDKIKTVTLKILASVGRGVFEVLFGVVLDTTPSGRYLFQSDLEDNYYLLEVTATPQDGDPCLSEETPDALLFRVGEE